MASPQLTHKEKKDSTTLYFIAALIPLVNLWVGWKIAENIAGHKLAVEKWERLEHAKPKESTTKWFLILLAPAIYSIIATIALGYYFSWSRPMMPNLTTTEILMIAVVVITAIVLALYPLWKTAELVSGHEKTYQKYEALGHREKKGSTALWLLIGLVPLLNLYLIWKAADVVSAHEVVYT